MPRVIVATGGTSGTPEFAGSTWVRLQYMLGLQELGVESVWVDRLGPETVKQRRHSLDYLMRRFGRLACEFGFQGRYCVVYNGGEAHFGMTESELVNVAESADLLLNIGGQPPPSGPLSSVPRRAYIDVDPGFTQIWAHQRDLAFDSHNFFFTMGQNVGRPEFTIPTKGTDWTPILPPVCLSRWPATIDASLQRFSTVADWRGSQDAIFEDQYYGGKRSEFIRFLDVPLQAEQRIELALTIGQQDYEDIGLLDGHNWRVRDPYSYAGDPESYQEFIQYSRAEFSVAKSGYVRSNSGWVSDRTACYLASGKPALVQSTGFEWSLPTGKGLLTFETPEEAVAGIHDINEHYLEHCAAAREIAEQYFDSGKVLKSLLERVGL